MKKEEYGELATVVGRYYAMDRDKRWERIEIAVDGGEGEKLGEGKCAVDEIKANYEKDYTDEFLKPIIINGDAGRIKGAFVFSISLLSHSLCARSLTIYSDGDTLFFFNYRSDRMRELVTVLGLPEKPMEVTVPKDLVRLLHPPSRFIPTLSPCTMPTPLSRLAHNHHVALQHRVPLPCRLPAAGHDQRSRGVVGGAGCEAGACCSDVSSFPLVLYSPSPHHHYILFLFVLLWRSSESPPFLFRVSSIRTCQY